MGLKNKIGIKKPTQPWELKNAQKALEFQILDYYRCLDMEKQKVEIDEDDEHGETRRKPSSDEEEDSDDDDEDEDDLELYSKERQEELSYTQPMLIKAYALLASGHSLTLNLKGFQPFFYIKIPETFTRAQTGVLTKALQSMVYYKFKKHLVKTKIVIRKPFDGFTGKDTFKFFKLSFKNKQAYDKYAQKLANPICVPGLHKGAPYKYDLYESNIEPIIKFIHLTGINPAGWGQIDKFKYEITRKRTTTTDFEVDLHWEDLKPLEKNADAPINVAAFDIEADSSHGDFPIAIKNYQKLAQDFITMYNEYGTIQKKKKGHWLFQKNPKRVIEAGLKLVFDDNYNNNGIHQIITMNHRKPHPGTVTQLAYAISNLFQTNLAKPKVADNVKEVQDPVDPIDPVDPNQIRLDSDYVLEQIWDLLESNLPQIQTTVTHGSHYLQLGQEILAQMKLLDYNNNERFATHPIDVIEGMINLAFNDDFDGFILNCIYTKHNLKPNPLVLEAIVPDILKILNDCANFVHHKKLPSPPTFKTLDEVTHDKNNMSQDSFVKQLTDLFDTYLPKVEGDQTIQIGTTFQILGEPDCYLKHIITLGSCEAISNDELIKGENAGIYLPAEDLAKDLIDYELQMSKINEKVDDKTRDELIKVRVGEIRGWDIEYRKAQCHKAAEYRRLRQSQTDQAIVIVESFATEREVLMAWQELIIINDPSILITYNGFGFDMNFLYGRAIETGCDKDFCKLGRLKDLLEPLLEQKLSSAGLGDNTLKYIPMSGRVQIDLYKVIQKDEKMDSYKLDSVCHKFLYKEKMDLPPQEIFIKQKGSARDRKEIAVYCLIDCILCNRLVCKMDIINKNMAMGNVCKVPLSYLFLRGQGVKLFSLVAEFCSQKGFLIKVLPKADPLNDDSYEGAIVLKPDCQIYFDPVAVSDFNSLYPSSMISENISHDSFVEIDGPYDNLPGYEYVDIEYDTYKWITKPGTKKRIKIKVGVEKCRYAQLPNGEKSILPEILLKLLGGRKAARKKMETETDAFKLRMLDGQQLAMKITANSLYGQCGAKTSPICKTPIAASTTAVGRRMIIFSKKYVERTYRNVEVVLDLDCTCTIDKKTKEKIPNKYTGMKVYVKDTVVVYGDTDSIFQKFNVYQYKGGPKLEGLDAIFVCMSLCRKSAGEISSQLKKPQNLDFEKVIDPFILFTPKRYHGKYYTKMCQDVHYQQSMGIATKRRDNAPIVKDIFGGALNIIMEERDVEKAFQFVLEQSMKLLKGEFPIEKFTISKALRSYYKKPNQIAHNVLAQRQAQRDPGNKFASNDRVPFCFFAHPNPVKGTLMGDRIETVNYIKQNNLPIDYNRYLSNQVMKPVSQIFNLVPGFEKTTELLTNLAVEFDNERSGMRKLDTYFIKKSTRPNLKTLMDLAREKNSNLEILDKKEILEDEDLLDTGEESDLFDDGVLYDEVTEIGDIEDQVYETNYENPDF